MNQLRAVVIGAGWAGEGHTLALRDAGVEVVAMCGRSRAPAYARAEQLQIPNVRFDWRQALEEFRPDIVAVGTPGDTHCEMAVAAAGLGCHVVVDKPLGLSARQAADMLRAVEQAGVKHAYGTTSRYAPSLAYTRDLIQAGVIGRLAQVQYEQRGFWDISIPSNWFLQTAQGGGMLFNMLTHTLGQTLRVTGGRVARAAGMVTDRLERLPAGESGHDFREMLKVHIPADQVKEWVPADGDLGYNILMEMTLPDGTTCQGLQNISLQMHGQFANQAVFAGREGTIVLKEPPFQNKVTLYSKAMPEGEERSVPQAYFDALPPLQDPVQRHWNQLFREFVADIRGEGYAGYPTFLDGWVANEIIDITRSGQGWKEIAAHP